MKRTKMLSMLMALCMIACMFIVPGNLSAALAADTIPEAVDTYLDDNYDSESISGYVLEPKGGVAEHVYDAETQSGYLRIVRTVDSTDFARITWNYYRENVAAWSEHVVFSADIKSTNIGRFNFKVNGTATEHNNSFATLLEIYEGTGKANLKSTAENSISNIFTYTPSEEYTNITFVFNCVEDTYSFFWDGELKAQDLPLPFDNFGKLTSFRFEAATLADKTVGSEVAGEWMIDNVKVYSYTEASNEKVENAGTADADVKAKYNAAETPADVYVVDVTWGAMEFDYYVTSQKWDTDAHKWVEDTAELSGWQVKDASNTITLANHSSVAVNARFRFAANAEYTALTGSFTYNNAALSAALAMDAPTTGVKDVTPYVVSFMPGGTIADTHSTTEYAKIGAITVTLE